MPRMHAMALLADNKASIGHKEALYWAYQGYHQPITPT